MTKRANQKDEIYFLLYFASDNTVSNLQKYKCTRRTFTKNVDSVEKKFVEVGYGAHADVGEILHEGTLKEIKEFTKANYPTHSMNDEESDKENDVVIKKRKII